ncbi:MULTISPECIES: GtrA family protein [Ramlibacter]|uniref:GtrA family protein n=1 Tax=Ramlibacter pinisoli TaxID=2682844 RepID=A0A6N8ITS9_9BURK|nr:MULTISPECIES: GtrA family protein [Ramlibacter]MBA2964615.1 GtrA family protein [Ramlibacter sp. CGMCC 1.13660]MVQ29580.1 GtrA family protein [Ramlibacter pinisoli]
MGARVAALPPLVRFGLVGTVGFVVDGGLLQLLVTFAGWGPIAARLVSFPAAVLATWWLNRTVTFQPREGGSLLASLGRYVAVSLVGTGVNFGIYTGLVLASPLLAARPIVPFAVASAAALVFNYLGSKHFAFKG